MRTAIAAALATVLSLAIPSRAAAGPEATPDTTTIQASPAEAAAVSGVGPGASASPQVGTPTQAAPEVGALAAPDDRGRQEGGIFYKGELGSPGAPRLEPTHNAFFVGVGYYNTGGWYGQHYARVTPELSLFLHPMKDQELVLRLQAPVNMMIYDFQNKTSANHGRYELRKADWNTASDYLKVFKQVTLGRKEDHLFVNIGITHGVSIGHGAVMRRYDANPDLDRTRLGLQLDAYNDYAGFESFLADIAFQTQVMGGLVFVKPLSLFSDDVTAKSFSLGAHYTTDLEAPKSLVKQGAFIPTDSSGYPQHLSTQLGIYGFDIEVKPVHLGTWLDLKVYGDYSKIANAGGGMTGGLLMRSSFGSGKLVSAARVRLEARYYDNNYVPQYFDGLYEIEKFRMVHLPGNITNTPIAPAANLPTKYEAVVNAPSGGRHTSVYGEATYAIVNRLVLGAGLERVTDLGTYNLLVHLEVPAIEILRLYLSYQKLGFGSMGDALPKWQGKAWEALEPSVVLTAQARLMILPFLFLNGIARQMYEWNQGVGVYESRLDYLATLEVGWEFN